MGRILSVSYDETLLRTRELLLKSAGHRVTSAHGFHESVEASGTPCELAIIGHSIPRKDKLDIIKHIRDSNPNVRVVALTRAGESKLSEVDYYVNPGDPEDLLRAIAMILNPAARRAPKVTAIR